MDIDFRLPAVPADEKSFGLEVDSLSEQAVELLLGTIDDPDPATSPEAFHAAAALAEDVRIRDRYEAVVLHYAHRGSSRTSSIDGYRAAELREAASKTSGNVEPLQHQVMLGTLTAADFEEGTGRLRESGDEAVSIRSPQALADDVKRALLQQARLEGDRHGGRLDVLSISPAPTLLGALVGADFWRSRTLDQLAADQGVELRC